MTHRLYIVITGLIFTAGCASRVTYPPDQATLDACSKDCLEQWKSCQGQGCDADRQSCVKHCRQYGGVRGGGRVTLEVPTTK